jgi:hypothetical protein
VFLIPVITFGFYGLPPHQNNRISGISLNKGSCNEKRKHKTFFVPSGPFPLRTFFADSQYPYCAWYAEPSETVATASQWHSAARQ